MFVEHKDKTFKFIIGSFFIVFSIITFIILIASSSVPTDSFSTWYWIWTTIKFIVIIEILILSFVFGKVLLDKKSYINKNKNKYNY